MSFLQGLLTARSHLAFLGGLAIALSAIAALQARPKQLPPLEIDSFSSALALDKKDFPLRPTGVPLTPKEREWAQTAWRYFENNYQPQTGLVNAADNYPSTTLWDLGSYAMGLEAAFELGIIDETTFDTRTTKLLGALEKLALLDGLPNKAYNTVSLAMVDYNNVAQPDGIGWSALDIARIGVPFTALSWQHPKHTVEINRLLTKWQLDGTTHLGELQGARRNAKGALERIQEGRYGYEQYAAKSLFLLGQDVSRAIRYNAHYALLEVSGKLVVTDSRLPAQFDGTHNALLSEPYILEGIEYGLNETTLPIAAAVYRAQRGRFEATGTLTAVTEDNLDRAPYFVYSSVINDRKPWAVFSPDGKPADGQRCLSVKAAIGWGMLFGDAYADGLLAAVSTLFDPAKGWYSGRYEIDGSINHAITSNTNGVVLESLLYKVRGPLLRAVHTDTHALVPAAAGTSAR